MYLMNRSSTRAIEERARESRWLGLERAGLLANGVSASQDEGEVAADAPVEHPKIPLSNLPPMVHLFHPTDPAQAPDPAHQKLSGAETTSNRRTRKLSTRMRRLGTIIVTAGAK
ncbi:hypothetical protein AX14_011094 [Amanita brunnescens Koide BX004]|nr:hypothetical protein AX14_011094 [Amanita brunnescens Koide BX004]